jgi:hypothetical protein
MNRTLVFDRNGVVGYGETGADGNRWYTVTDTRTGESATNTAWAIVLPIARRWADHTVEPAQVVSPLVESEQRRSGLAGGGVAAEQMTGPGAAKLAEAVASDGKLRRGSGQRYGYANRRQLVALARRGWLTLDHDIRPTGGIVTPAGVTALLRWMASH